MKDEQYFDHIDKSGPNERIEYFSEAVACHKKFGAKYEFSDMADDHENADEKQNSPIDNFDRDEFGIVADRYEMLAKRDEPLGD